MDSSQLTGLEHYDLDAEALSIHSLLRRRAKGEESTQLHSERPWVRKVSVEKQGRLRPVLFHYSIAQSI